MSLTDLVLPVVKVVFTVGFFGIFLFVIYKGTFGRNSNWRYWLRYNVFKKEIPKKIVKECVFAIENDINVNKLVKKKIIEGELNTSQGEEFIYVYNTINKTMGG